MQRIRSKKLSRPRTLVCDCKDSSNLVAARYDTKTHEMQVDFKGNTTYAYESVPRLKWDEFRMSDSRGSYLAREIKPHHTVRKVA